MLDLESKEVQEVLDHVKEAAQHPFIYPMFVFAAHILANQLSNGVWGLIAAPPTAQVSSMNPCGVSPLHSFWAWVGGRAHPSLATAGP